MSGFEIRWLDAEKTLLLHSAEGEWSFEEYFEGINRAVEMIKAVQHRVDIISYLNPEIPPPRGNLLLNLRKAVSMFPDNVGIVIAAGGTPFAVAMARLVIRVNRLGHRVFMAKDIPEAHKMLAQRRSARESRNGA